MLAASGAIEAACTVMTLKEGIIPPTINLDEKDDNCKINVITEISATESKVAVSSSFGFGGVNASVVLKAFH
jgi:3-oxoacyl-[acyl-carrier-protein] synthase II